MRKEEPSDHVRLAACNALLNSLEFTRSNFSKEVLIITIFKQILDFLFKKKNEFFCKDRKKLHNANHLRGHTVK